MNIGRSMREANLDSLPVELLCAIAGECEARTAIALSRTCRLLYQACYTAAVFRSVLINNQQQWDHQTLDIDLITSYLRDDRRLWARCAVADARALSIRHGLEDINNCFIDNFTTISGKYFTGRGIFDRFLRDSTLLLLAKHPILYDRGFAMGVVFTLRDMLSEDDPYDIQKDFEDVGVLALCNCAALIAIPPQHQMFENAARNNMLLAHSTLLGSRTNVIRSQSAAVFQLANFAYLIRSSQKCDIRSFNRAPMPAVSPPSLHMIPVPKLGIGLSKRDADTARVSMSLNHHGLYEAAVKQLLTPEYFQDDTWAGYYSNTARYRVDVPVGFHFDSPMDNISLSASYCTPNSQPKWPAHQQPYIDLKGQGEDCVGPFTLKGFITEEGIGDLVKQYVGRHGWRWWLSITPYGMYGVWYSNTQSIVPPDPQNVRHFSGSFWLWKKSWARSQ